MGVADHDDGGLVAVGGQTVGIGQARRHFTGGQIALVADDRTGGQAAVDDHLDGHRGVLSGRDDAGAGIVGRLNGQPAHQGGDAAHIRLHDAVQSGGSRHIGRVGGHGVGQHHVRGRDGAAVADIDGVAQGVARIHDTGRSVVNGDRDGLVGIKQGQVAHHVTGGIVGRRRVRIIGGLIGLGSAADAAAAQEALVFDDQSVHGRRIHHHIEGHGSRIACRQGRIGMQATGGWVSRCVDRNPVVQRIDARARIGHRIAVEPCAVGHVGGAGRGEVAQPHVDGIFIADVVDGDGVAQGVAGHQHGRIIRQIGGSFLNLEPGRRIDEGFGGVGVPRDIGIVAQYRCRDDGVQSGLVERHRAAGNRRRKGHFENHHQPLGAAACSAEIQIGDMDQTGAVDSARRIGAAGVRAGGHAGQHQAAR